MRRQLGSLVTLAALACPFLALADEPEEERRDRVLARQEWNASFSRDGDGLLLAERRLAALRQACEMPVDPLMAAAPAGTYTRSDVGPSAPGRRGALAFPGIAWEPIGPAPATTTFLKLGNIAGRVSSVVVHPTDPKIVFLATATGGIWKSTDGGTSWRPVADNAPSLATSHIVFSPSNPSILYAATGEVDTATSEFSPSRSLGTYLGAGLLRSVDGGETWTRIDVDLPVNSILSRVLVHPQDPNQVTVGVYIRHNLTTNGAAVGGVYASTDGGVHFTRTLNHAVSDMVQDPLSADTIYVGIGATRGCSSCAVSSGVYKSTDFGKTLTPVLVSTTPGATFAVQTGNVKLGVSKADRTVLYASVIDTADKHSGGGIFRSTDAGATWTKRAVDGGMCPATGSNQCFYDHYITADPSNAQTVYFGSIDLYKSTDGAGTWVALTEVYSGQPRGVHPDQHGAFVVPNGGPVYFANDGGVVRSTNGGTTFENLNQTLTLAQFNGVSLHPVDPTIAFGGTQDNGTMRAKGSVVWSDRIGGDGGFNLVHATDPTKVFATREYANMHYSETTGDTFANPNPCTTLLDCATGDGKETMAFYAPIAAAPNAPDTIFFGSNRVWASTTFGKKADGWTARSPAAVFGSGGTLRVLRAVGDGNGVLWAGASTGEILFSTDGGATFADRNKDLPKGIITDIETVSADGLAAYVTMGGFWGLPSRHVFRTNDGGQTFTNVSGNLPDVPVRTIAVDPTDPSGLFVGTDVGVFRSTNGGAAWVSFNQGLPNVSVSELKFHPVSGDLVASTYGRGMFKVKNAAPQVPPPTADFTYAPAPPAPGQSLKFTDRSTNATGWAWDFGDGGTSTEPSPRHAFAAAGSFPVTLVASNAGGSSTKTQTVTVQAGVASPVTLQVPVVLDVFGIPPTHFTSDLVAVNRSGAATRVSIVYLAAPGTPGASGPRLGEVLPAGGELRLSDVIGYLRANGYALPAGETAIGTFRITFEDVSDPALVFAGSRTSTPNPNTSIGGSFGLFSSGVPESAAVASEGVIVGLREDGSFRSNLAIVDVPGGSGPVSLTIQRYDGATGQAAGDPIPYTLGAGEWKQFGSILKGSGAAQGYAVVRKTGGGSDRFLVYGVVNDGPSTGGGTSDGSFIGPDASEGLIPIVLRVNSSGVVFTSELFLTNPGSSAVEATLVYTPAPLLGGTGTPLTGKVTVAAGRQLRIPDAIAYLRDTLGFPLPADSTNQGGALRVSGVRAYVRTSNPNPDTTVGGTFGLAYPAIGEAAWARTEAWVYGLVQDDTTRSNLALVNAAASGGKVAFLVDVHDPATAGSKKTVRVELGPGEWTQLTKVLDGTGLASGYARIRPETGSAPFVAYAVLNDGANAGERTSDGSFVAMSGVK